MSFVDIEQVEIAIDKRTVDKEVLLRVAGGRVSCAIATRVIRHFMYRLQSPLNNSIKQYYSVRVFRSMARLDLPTFEDPAVQRQTEAAWSTSGQSSVAWDTINMVAGLISTVIRLTSQVSILITILYNQRDGYALQLYKFVQLIPIIKIFEPIDDNIEFWYFNVPMAKRKRGIYQLWRWGIFSCAFSVYICIYLPQFGQPQQETKIGSGCQGWNKSSMVPPTVKKLLLVTWLNIWLIVSVSYCLFLPLPPDSFSFFTKTSIEYRDAVKRLGDKAGDFHEIISRIRYKDKLNLSSLLQEPLRELPMVMFSGFRKIGQVHSRMILQIVFTLRAVQYPASIPLSLASLQLIRENSSSFTSWAAFSHHGVLRRLDTILFTSSLLGLLDQTGYMAEQLASVRRLYEIENITNKVVDGREPFPENQQTLNDGISVEFR
jgi:hypothetical protein